jgi:hypothetical protein
MKQRLLFEGELSDPELDKVLPKLISKAIETEQDVYVRWNGVTLRVSSTDTVDMLMAKYNEQLIVNGMYDRLKAPIDGRDKHLYRIKNRLAEFYIVAHSFDEAANEMKKRLDKADYGFTSYRTVPGIDHLAVQHFYNDKQSFDDSEANLIIVGD